MFALLLLFAGAGIGVHVEEVEGVEAREVAVIAEAVARAIAVRTGTVAAVDDWSACEERERCGEVVRASLGVEWVVFLRVFGGPTSVRVIAELRGARSANAELRGARSANAALLEVRARAQSDFARGGAIDAGAIAASLFAAGARGAVAVVPAGAEVRDGGAVAFAPWVVIAGSAIVLGAGIALAASSARAQSALEMSDHPGAEGDRLDDRVHAHGVAAGVLVGVAGVGVVSAVLMWID